jgi:hypothetical protein
VRVWELVVGQDVVGVADARGVDSWFIYLVIVPRWRRNQSLV